MESVNDMSTSTRRMYFLALCLQSRSPQCPSVFQTVNELEHYLGGSAQNLPMSASVANIFNLYAEKLFHIIRQALQKMSNNPAQFTFVLQTLSTTHYTFLVKDCFYDRLYREAVLGTVD